MIEKLKRKYPNSISHVFNTPFFEAYVYIQVSDQEIIGIPREDISEEEANLLTLLFPLDEKTEVKFRLLTEKEQWTRYLIKNSSALPITSWDHVRFIFFTVLSKETTQRDAEEAFLTLFHSDSLIIWYSATKGVLIEPKSIEQLRKHELEPVLSTLESDFYIQLRLFIGSFYSINSELHEHFTLEEKWFSIGEHYAPENKLQNISTVFPFLMVLDLIGSCRKWFSQHLLGETLNDKELISTIKTYIECNSNASLAAKKLFMHRNSLQYRIDKFIERTDLDIRTFEDALTVYLLIVISLSEE